MNGKNEDDDVKKGLKGIFGFLGAPKRQALSAEDEIKDFVADSDDLLDDEKRMIHEILDLGDMDAGEIMTPRVDMILVEGTETVRQAVDRMMGTGYSRLPVFQGDIDRIVGVVHYKDLVPPVLDGYGDDLAVDYAFEPLFVPESKDVFPLLAEMQTKRQQMAIVVDEYGGTDGLITVEDIVEEIVGEIIDESDIENKFITPLSDGTWLVDGRFPVEDALKLGWPVTESDDYETMAGWLMGMIDFVPQVGDEFEFGGYRFKIQAMRRRRISNIRVTREVGADNAPAVQAEDDAGRDPAEAAAENAEHPASH